jgi:hypothetical protein
MTQKIKQRTANTGLAKVAVQFSPQTHLWLIKVWFSASTFVVKIATFAKPENVKGLLTNALTTLKTDLELTDERKGSR